MKKEILILSTLFFAACGGNRDKVSADLSYEERVVDVCDCFSKEPESTDCYMLQADHAEYVEDIIEFSKDIGDCNVN